MNFYSIAQVMSPEAQLSPCNIVTLQVRTGFKCWHPNLLALSSLPKPQFSHPQNGDNTYILYRVVERAE